MLTLVSLKAKDANYDPCLNISDTIMASDYLRFPMTISAISTSYTVCALQRGKRYKLFLNAPNAKEGAFPKIHFPNRTDARDWYQGRVMSFVARGECENIDIVQTGRIASLDVLLSVGCEDCAAETVEARNGNCIETSSDTYSAEDLVQEVFIGGDCFDVNSSSISYEGEDDGRGSFSNGNSSINIEEGVILSTGRTSNALGPNAAYNTGNSFWTFPSNDPDLRGVIGNNSTLIHDVSSLEFDFTPTSDTVSFEFVFASEEYCEYAGSQYNDVFGFFISGPGINGPFSNNAENIAIVPGTSDYVTINNVNHASNPNYYVSNVPSWQHIFMPSWLSCPGHDTNDGLAINDIEYDGFTTLLTAIAKVEPCETYHIKLIVADVNDAYYDSAVFLKANSFNAGGTAVVSTDVPDLGGDIAFEGCKDGVFIFQRANDDLSEDLVVNFTIGSNSTATEGSDFDVLPTSITIPAGDSIIYLPVAVFDDILIEGNESIILELDAPCSCNVPSTVLYIADMDSLKIELGDEFLCESTTLNLTPTISGGIPNFSYLWNTNDTTNNISITPTDDTEYVITVSDACGNSATASTNVEIVGLPTATISGLQQVCAGSPQAELLINFTGDGPWSFTYTIDNTQSFQIDSISQNPYILTTEAVGTYLLTVVSSHGCEGTVSGAGSVLPIDLGSTILSSEVSCPGANDGSISLTVNGGQPPYTYLWSNSAGVSANPANLAEGTYTVTITDSNGCTEENSIEVMLNPDVPQVEAGEPMLLNCDIPMLSLAGSGSTGSNYSYLWTTRDGRIVSGETTNAPMVDRPGIYLFVITNTATGCSQGDEVEVTIDTLAPEPVLAIIGPQELDCRNPMTVIDATSSLPVGKLSFLWSTLNGSIAPGDELLPQLQVGAAGTYDLQITDTQNGCHAETSIDILSNMDLPVVTIFPPKPISCVDTTVQIDATGSSSGASFLYSWSTGNGNILLGGDGLTPLVNQQGTYTLSIMNNNTGCELHAEVMVAIDITPPFAEAGTADSLDCDSPEITLAGTASSVNDNFTLQWLTADGNIMTGAQSLNPVVDLGGIYTLVVTSEENGCTASDDVTVVENTNVPYDVDIIASPPACFGEEGSMEVAAVLGGVEPYLYSLDEGMTFFSDPTAFSVLSPGAYTLTVQDINGCEYWENFVIPNTLPLVVDVQSEIEISLGHLAALRAQTNIPESQIDTIIWSPTDSLSCTNCLNPMARPVENTLYTVTLIDENGCVATDQVMIKVDKTRKVYIPNAFTPDGDGINDKFIVYADAFSVKRVSQLQVFNRWGAKVYEMRDFQPNDAEAGWDGKMQGEILNPAVFVYFAEVEFVDGLKRIYKGDISILSN